MPETFAPPTGLCRVWLTGVPASQQPAPTDCASAIKNRPSNSAIVFGPKHRTEPHELESFTRRGGSPAARTFSPNARGARQEPDTRGDATQGAGAVRVDATPKSVRKPDKPEKPR